MSKSAYTSVHKMKINESENYTALNGKNWTYVSLVEDLWVAAFRLHSVRPFSSTLSIFSTSTFVSSMLKSYGFSLGYSSRFPSASLWIRYQRLKEIWTSPWHLVVTGVIYIRMKQQMYMNYLKTHIISSCPSLEYGLLNFANIASSSGVNS